MSEFRSSPGLGEGGQARGGSDVRLTLPARPENVAVVLSNPKNLTACAAPQLGPNGPAELTINDDDVSTFHFSSAAYSAQEDIAGGHATITVNRAGVPWLC